MSGSPRAGQSRSRPSTDSPAQPTARVRHLPPHHQTEGGPERTLRRLGSVPGVGVALVCVLPRGNRLIVLTDQVGGDCELVEVGRVRSPRGTWDKRRYTTAQTRSANAAAAAAPAMRPRLAHRTVGTSPQRPHAQTQGTATRSNEPPARGFRRCNNRFVTRGVSHRLTAVSHISGTTDGVVGHDVVAQGRSGARPARSSMIMVMNASGSWKPRALARMRPIDALLDSAMPLVSFHSMVASIEDQ